MATASLCLYPSCHRWRRGHLTRGLTLPWRGGLKINQIESRGMSDRARTIPEVAKLMENIARDKARPLSLVVRLLHPAEVERNVQTNLKAMIEVDQGAVEQGQ